MKASSPSPQKRRRRRRSIWGNGTFRLLMIFLAVVLSFASGTPQMVWAVGTRMANGSGPPCAVVRVIDGDSVLLHCHGPGLGFERADIVGYDAPELTTARCLREIGKGLESRWVLQVGLWNARDVSFKRQAAGADGTTRIALYLDGADARWRMLSKGNAMRVGGLSRLTKVARPNDWCPRARPRIG